MRALANLFKAVLFVAVLLTAVAYLLPRQVEVVRQAQIAAAPARIWPWLAEPRRWPAWSPWQAREPDLVPQYSGPASGVGAGWSWRSASQGQGHMVFTAATPPQRLAFQLTFDDMGSTAEGAFVLEPVGADTRVTWRMRSDLGLNPLSRWFGLAMDRLVGRDFETGLARLAEQVRQAS